jgi:hypothetical protein
MTDTKNDSERLSLTEIWHKGCLGETLSPHDAKHFADLAKSRFYTFRLSMGHAHQSTRGEKLAERTKPLISGFASELMSSPGLERFWRDSDYFNDASGKQVAAELERRYQNSH